MADDDLPEDRLRWDDTLRRQDEQLRRQGDELRRREDELRRQEHELQRRSEELRRQDDELRRRDDHLRRQDDELRRKDDEIRRRDDDLRRGRDEEQKSRDGGKRGANDEAKNGKDESTRGSGEDGDSNEGKGGKGDAGGKDEQKDKDKDKKGGKKHNILFLVIFGVVALLAAIAILLYHFLVGQYHIVTKDAYVNGNLIRLQPQVAGTVTRITVDQTQPVQTGQVLIALDPRDAEVSLQQARANLAQTVRDVVQLFSQAREQEAILAAQQAQLELSQRELKRDQALIGAHGVSQEEVDRMQESVAASRAGVEQARASLTAVRAQIEGTEPRTHPRVLLAEASLRNAWLALNRTQVRSPLAGYMVRREVQVGEQVTPATEMVALAPLDSVWIDANFKETQLEKLRIGQPVTVHADIYGSHVDYHGRVLGLTAGTGAALAVLPPENATGNWIKIVQRLPVRIGLDARELNDHPLFLGLSTRVDIDVHDQRGEALSRVPAWPAEIRTDVYAAQDAGVDQEISRILDENLQGAQDARGRR